MGLNHRHDSFKFVRRAKAKSWQIPEALSIGTRILNIQLEVRTECNPREKDCS